MPAGRDPEAGQAFPVYITVVAALLFLAFVYFAVGQAAAVRNSGQTAADSAALAAAQDARGQLRDGWLDVILDPAEWAAYLRGEEYDTVSACRNAAVFAEENDAELWGDRCVRLSGEEGFRVTIRTLGTVGDSVVPGTADRHASATATAVLEPRCFFDPPAPTVPPPTTPPPTNPAPTGTATPEPTPTPSPEPEPITGLFCDGVEWTIDPEHPRLPDAAELFTVRLVD
ncbi:pilus assembly protein TadG-related protein [Streptomyces sp. NPDC046374]|uniref:pilus assembly protein TadG-related protein n=1 Tax=Streptomyces sp. NPDC046374 TaxID=3154917 RepID=UPI0033CDD1D5